MAFTFNGFGTKFYGRTDPGLDGSVVMTEWIVALYFPILPLGSFRVLPTGKATNLVVYNSASYLMHPVPLNAKQVRNGYAVTLSVAAIVAAIIYFGQ